MGHLLQVSYFSFNVICFYNCKYLVLVFDFNNFNAIILLLIVIRWILLWKDQVSSRVSI